MKRRLNHRPEREINLESKRTKWREAEGKLEAKQRRSESREELKEKSSLKVHLIHVSGLSEVAAD